MSRAVLVASLACGLAVGCTLDARVALVSDGSDGGTDTA